MFGRPRRDRDESLAQGLHRGGGMFDEPAAKQLIHDPPGLVRPRFIHFRPMENVELRRRSRKPHLEGPLQTAAQRFHRSGDVARCGEQVGEGLAIGPQPDTMRRLQAMLCGNQSAMFLRVRFSEGVSRHQDFLRMLRRELGRGGGAPAEPGLNGAGIPGSPTQKPSRLPVLRLVTIDSAAPRPAAHRDPG